MAWPATNPAAPGSVPGSNDEPRTAMVYGVTGWRLEPEAPVSGGGGGGEPPPTGGQLFPRGDYDGGG